MHPDLDTTRTLVQSGHTTVSAALEQAIAAAESPACAHAFVHTSFDAARAVAIQAHTAQRPLAGAAASIKDLFDVCGQTSAAGSSVLADAPPAAQDSPAVARLRAAGACILGRTHMVEFAFSGVGTNPHCATPVAWDGYWQRPIAGPARVPGGSSSGAAVSVASGAALIGLGSDTGGSLRIPAALNGIVGFKSTARLVPCAGTIPLSPSLDTVGAITRSVADARIVHEALAARRVTRSTAPLSAWRLAVAHTLFLDGIDATVQHAFNRTLDILRTAGAHITDIALPEVADITHINASGGFAAAESYAWHRSLLAQRGAMYDPRVRNRIERGADISAADYLELQRARQDWIVRMQRGMANFDALLSPTVPLLAPLLDSVAPANGFHPKQDSARDSAFWHANGLLLRNTSVVNLLDGCALSLPCHSTDELPVGLMVSHGALHDDAILHISSLIEAALAQVHRVR